MLHDTPLSWLFLDLNSYFASVEQQLRPELRGRPIAVVPVADTDHTCCIAASYEAKQFGIRTGTPVGEARAQCPDMVFIKGSHDRYITFHERIIKEVERHIPIEKVYSIDEVGCRLTGRQRLQDEAMALAHRIKSGIRAHVGEYLTCSVGIAPSRLLAKIATNLQKPDGLIVLPAEDVPRRLAHLKLNDLPGIGHNMLKRLYQGGIYDVPSFYALQPKRARQIWGSVGGERFWYELHGMDIDEFPTNKSTVGHSHVLPPELRPREEARLVARRLIVKAAGRLRASGHLCAALDLSVRLEDGRSLGLSCKGFAVNDNLTLVRMLDTLWSHMLSRLSPTLIKKVSIQCHHLSPAQYATPDLFETIAGDTLPIWEHKQKLSGVMDTLNARFGRDMVTLGPKPRYSSKISCHQDSQRGIIAFGLVAPATFVNGTATYL